MSLLEQEYKCDNKYCIRTKKLDDGYIQLLSKTKFLTTTFYFCSFLCLSNHIREESTSYDFDNEEE